MVLRLPTRLRAHASWSARAELMLVLPLAAALAGCGTADPLPQRPSPAASDAASVPDESHATPPTSSDDAAVGPADSAPTPTPDEDASLSTFGDDAAGASDAAPGPTPDPTDEASGTATNTSAIVGLRVFDPADYPGYDATGRTESSDAFNAAIAAASAYATAHPSAADLFVPTAMRNGPNAPQAIVRVRPGVFMIDTVYVRSNVRIEISAAALLIPVGNIHSLLFQGADMPAEGGVSGTRYIDNWTLTSWGRSSTFPDVGGRTRTKSVRYPVTFPDGTTMTLADRFVVDLDTARYPTVQGTPGDGPRLNLIKIRHGRHFLVENFLAYANPGTAGHAPDGAGQGSNSYPASAGPALAIDGPVGQPNTESAVQPRNGTVRRIHCEGCTRGYGITEIHAGVDLDWRYISNRGGVTIRWESTAGGRSTRQTARQCVGHDGNTVYLMSNHGYPQQDLHASFGLAFGMDSGIRTEGTDGMTTSSSITDTRIIAGPDAQVIIRRDSTDDYWWYAQSSWGVNNNIGVSLARLSCSGTFTRGNVGGGC